MEYDGSRSPDATAWLALDDDERRLLVQRHHEGYQPRVGAARATRGPSARCEHPSAATPEPVIDERTVAERGTMLRPRMHGRKRHLGPNSDMFMLTPHRATTGGVLSSAAHRAKLDRNR